MSRSLIVSLLIFCCAVTGAAGEQTSPFTIYNLYCRGSIGAYGLPYQGDIEGLGAARSSVWFSDVSLNEANLSITDYSFYCGDDLNISGIVNYGGLNVGGDLLLTNTTIAGDVIAGQFIAGNGGSIQGDVVAGSSTQLSGVAVSGTISQFVPYTTALDWDYLSEFFVLKSLDYAGRAATGQATTGTALQMTATTAVNVFDIDASDLSSAWSVSILGGTGMKVIINVSGVDVDLDNLDWQISAELERSDLLINCHEATSVSISNMTVLGNLLAPFATCSFPSGTIEGGLWVSGLSGSGSINQGYFSEPDEVTSVFEESWGSIKILYIPSR